MRVPIPRRGRCVREMSEFVTVSAVVTDRRRPPPRAPGDNVRPVVGLRERLAGHRLVGCLRPLLRIRFGGVRIVFMIITPIASPR
jgi:hypothetical protein